MGRRNARAAAVSRSSRSQLEDGAAAGAAATGSCTGGGGAIKIACFIPDQSYEVRVLAVDAAGETVEHSFLPTWVHFVDSSHAESAANVGRAVDVAGAVKQ